MFLKEAVGHFGSIAKVAAALGITRSAIYQWGDVVPELRAYQLERIIQESQKSQPDQAA